MSRRSRRRKTLPPGKFLTIPLPVAKTALGTLSGPEFRSFIAICAQSQPWSNGTAMLCRSVIREFSLGSARTVTEATKKMLEHGLIVQTRKAAQHRAAMFGVTHMPLNLDAMEKAGAAPLRTVSASNVEALKQTAALPTVVALQRFQGGSTTATNVEALGQKTGLSASTLEACGGISSDPALPRVKQSKNLASQRTQKGAAGELFGRRVPAPPDPSEHGPFNGPKISENPAR